MFFITAKLRVVTIFVCSRDKNVRQCHIMHTLFYKYVTSPRLLNFSKYTTLYDPYRVKIITFFVPPNVISSQLFVQYETGIFHNALSFNTLPTINYQLSIIHYQFTKNPVFAKY